MALSQSEILRNSTTTLQKLILHTPDDLFILSIIAHDGTVFTPSFLFDAYKINPVYFTYNGPPKLKEAYSIFFRLVERGMVEQRVTKKWFKKKSEFRTIITLRGHIYRITAHYLFGLWTFIIGVLLGVGMPDLNCKSNNTESNKQTQESRSQIPPASTDSSAYEKTYPPFDSSKGRIDTTDTTVKWVDSISRLPRHK